MAISKIYNGSSWASGVLKVWDGSVWQSAGKLWDGSSWVSFGQIAATLTIGASSPDAGWNSLTGMGSISPSPLSVNGQTLAMVKSSSSWDLEVAISDNSLSQDFFTSIVVEDGTGTERAFNTSSANMSTLFAHTVWRWGNGSFRVYNPVDASELRPIVINL